MCMPKVMDGVVEVIALLAQIEEAQRQVITKVTGESHVLRVMVASIVDSFLFAYFCTLELAPLCVPDGRTNSPYIRASRWRRNSRGTSDYLVHN